jgi:hypothetical protein
MWRIGQAAVRERVGGEEIAELVVNGWIRKALADKCCEKKEQEG